MIFELEVGWRFQSQLHIGSGMTVGNLSLTETYIPGSAIRGAFGSAYIKLFCENKKFAECTPNLNSCNKCMYPNVFLNNKHGEGCYFGPILPQSVRVTENYSVSIDPELKKAEKGKLFIYQGLHTDEGVNKIYLIESDGLDINKIKDELTVVMNTSPNIGGRRSWGWGQPEKVWIKFSKKYADVASLLEAKSREPPQEQQFEIQVITPIPLSDSSIESSLISSIKDMSEAFFDKKVSPPLISFQDLQVRLIGQWTSIPLMKHNQVRLFAIMPGTKINLSDTGDSLNTIKLGTILGLTPNNTLFTKTGYGIIQIQTEAT